MAGPAPVNPGKLPKEYRPGLALASGSPIRRRYTQTVDNSPVCAYGIDTHRHTDASKTSLHERILVFLYSAAVAAPCRAVPQPNIPLLWPAFLLMYPGSHRPVPRSSDTSTNSITAAGDRIHHELLSPLPTSSQSHKVGHYYARGER